ncbi:hypothetical protein AJ78_00410 [Emergomyces pasteurianus Ep9510]|uniref:Uncharacterized protein n=1 Tax=Emergomyces pasteurianus Ep9510 TaxID=1447872 RepID=A0A1J9PTU8_9EURO|nr:hypothetical protein AJ78_00410 [Emergomyces pasteurianus Ep9510]
MPIFDRLKRLDASWMQKSQLTNRELQEEVAANCRLSRLPADIKIHILVFTNISTIRALLQYLPLSTTSFRRLFDERKRAILAAIVKEKLSWEWSMIAGSDPYVPLGPLKSKYFNQIALVVCALFDEKRFEKMKRGTDDGWLRAAYKHPETIQLLRMQIYKTAKSNAFDLLRLLEEVQDEVKARAEVTMSQLKRTFGDAGRESWIVPWAKRNIYRALLIEWKLKLPDISLPEEIIGALNTDEGNQQSNSESQAVRSRLADEEWTILILLMETRASYRSRKVDTVKPTKLSPAGEESWKHFLGQLEKSHAQFIRSLGKGASTFPSFLDISDEGRENLKRKFPPVR